jgi:hypothetical protein
MEESLWREETRFDPVYMDGVLHPGFVEVGRSGRVYDRETALGATGGTIGAVLPLRGVTVAPIDGQIYIFRYVSEVQTPDGVERAERTSIWVNDGGRWLLRFHQGTPSA